jgi:CDP-diacylglycerol--glycerol-3-phosphate 3-phosphatidyltransferase
MWTKSLTISNFLSLLRVMLLVPIFQGLSQNTPEGTAWALFYMLIAIITDFLDGYFARKLNQITDLGKVLDPIADKVCIFGVTMLLTLPIRENPLPFWFLIVIFVREIAILTGGYIIYRCKNFVTPSNIWGKSTSTAIAAMLVSYVISIQPSSPWLFWLHYRFLLWLSISFIIVSSLSYGWRFLQIISADKKQDQRQFLRTNQSGSSTTPGQKTGES